jgi:hypothetical protein
VQWWQLVIVLLHYLQAFRPYRSDMSDHKNEGKSISRWAAPKHTPWVWARVVSIHVYKMDRISCLHTVTEQNLQLQRNSTVNVNSDTFLDQLETVHHLTQVKHCSTDTFRQSIQLHIEKKCKFISSISLNKIINSLHKEHSSKQFKVRSSS